MGRSFQQNVLIALSMVFPLLSVLPISLRFYAKRITKQTTLRAEDHLIIFAQILLFGLGAIVIVGTTKGNLGGQTHVDSSGTTIVNKAQEIFEAFWCEWVFQSVEKPALGSTKLSLVIWYRRIFRGKKFNIVSWIVGGLVVAWTVAFLFPTVFACRPISIIYNGTIEQLFSQCIDTITLLETFAITDVITDISVLSLPVPMVWQLQMSTRRKITVSGIFLLGTLAVVASVAKMAVYIVSCNIARNPSKNSNQASYVGPTMYISIIEISLGITAANLPMLRPVVTEMSNFHLFSSLSKSRRRGPPQTHTRRGLGRSSSKERLHKRSLGELQDEAGPWALGNNSHGDGGYGSVTKSGLNTYVSSNRLEAEHGDEIAMHDIGVRNDGHVEAQSVERIPWHGNYRTGYTLQIVSILHGVSYNRRNRQEIESQTSPFDFEFKAGKEVSFLQDI